MITKTKFFIERCQSELVNAQALNVAQIVRTGLPIFNSIIFYNWTQNLLSYLPRIKIPTLICTGGTDVLVPKGASFFMHYAIPSSILVEFIGKGHNLMVSNYKDFNIILFKFIQNCPLPKFFEVSSVDSCSVCPCAQYVDFASQACA